MNRKVGTIMRLNSLAVALAILVGILAFSQKASAHYDPVLGRWMEQDPVGELAMMGTLSAPVAGTPFMSLDSQAGSDPVTTAALDGATQRVGARLGWQSVDDPAALEYADGQNSYEMTGSNPVFYTDPSGLDRYIGGTLHHFLAVDMWKLTTNKNGCPCWKKIGAGRYDFALDAHNHGTAGAWPIISVGGALTFSSLGEVVGPGPLNMNDVSYTISSTPMADLALETQLDMQVVNPPNYSIWFYNCNDWVARWENYGIGDNANGKNNTIPICP
jgi:hypothetical protein